MYQLRFCSVIDSVPLTLFEILSLLFNACREIVVSVLKSTLTSYFSKVSKYFTLVTLHSTPTRTEVIIAIIFIIIINHNHTNPQERTLVSYQNCFWQMSDLTL